ncbi:hypothetical protein R6Q57_015933, partial [Mikania cordata]
KRVQDKYNQYSTFFTGKEKTAKPENVPNFINVFYDLVTDIITINQYQVTRAKAYNNKAGLENQCQVMCGNFLEMPFEDESFDGAYSIDATCHAPNLEDVVKEIFRVLKPGSMYVSVMEESVVQSSFEESKLQVLPDLNEDSNIQSYNANRLPGLNEEHCVEAFYAYESNQDFGLESQPS